MSDALVEGFLVTRQWQERDDSQSLLFWITTPDGPVELEFTGQESIAFVAREDLAPFKASLSGKLRFRDAPVELRTFDGADVSACYFCSQRELNVARTRARAVGITLYEADLRPTDRFLMERFITGSVRVEGAIETRPGYRRMVDPRIAKGDYRPELRLLSLDIETAISDDTLLSVAFYAPDFERVVMRGDPPAGVETPGYLDLVGDEAAVLSRTLEVIAEYDPDAIIGWNIVGFDMRFLQLRADALDAVEADAAVCAALAQRQAALVEALGRDERDASDLVAKHCVDDPSVGDLADDPTSSPRAQFDLDLSGDNVLKGSLLDDDDDEADDQFGTPTKSSAVALDACRELQARWERRERLLPIIKATERSIAQCARSCASRADALATRSLEELRGVGELQTTIHDAQANHLETHSDALEAKARAFAQLDTVRALPRVHAALCLEVARRRSYGTAAAAVVQKATEDVARLREVETKRRAKFSRLHGARLPRPLLRAVPGLVDPPAPFTPTFAPDERELPCISVEDLREDGAPRPRADSSDSALAPPNQASSHHSSDVAMEEKEGSSSEDDDHDDDDEQALRAKCARLECELAALRAEACEEKPRAVSAEDVSEAEEGPPQISFRRFELGDVALFLPTGAGDGRKSYLAFHHGCPHRYLAPSSVEAIRAAHQRYPDFILGRVTRCDAREASDADNPFRLPPGTAFHVLTVESL